MKRRIILYNFTLSLIVFLSGTRQAAAQSAKASDALFAALANKDSLLFDIAFNSCKVEALDKVLSKDFVFYHDNGYDGLTMDQSRANFVGNIQRFCANRNNRMRREIVKGSLQAFAVNNDEAIQTGIQRLYLAVSGQQEKQVEESKFSRTWKKKDGEWKMTTEMDFQVKTHFNNDPSARYVPEPYNPSEEPLYDVIARMDSLYFDTYNTCNLQKMDAMTADTIEFYHDRTGVNTSREEMIASIKRNICGKVTREIVPGSIEVYPIHNYGAVEIGYHKFHNNREPVGTPSKASKFIIIWKQVGGNWKMSRVVSLH